MAAIQKNLHTPITEAPNFDDMGPEERKVTQPATPGLEMDPRALTGYVRDMAMENLVGGRHMADAETLAPSPQYVRPGSAAEARQEEAAREYFSAPRIPAVSRAPLKAPGGA